MNVRAGFKDAKRVMIKVGSNVLTNEQGRLSIGRIGHIVEQIAKLVTEERKEVILVSSGAVAVGARRLDFQRRLSRSILQSDALGPPSNRAAASAGQAAFMALYEQLFAQFDLMVGNVLITHSDLSSPGHVKTFANTIDELLKCSIVPVLNENDVTNQVSANSPPWFVDNDSLSAKLATDLDAQLLLLLTDIDGVYTKPPGEKGGYLLDYHSPAIDVIKYGEKSSRGRGGMESKIRAAMLASQRGVDVVVASGFEKNVIDRVFAGEVMGTVFTENWEMQALTPRQTTMKAKACKAELTKIDGDTRTELLNKVSDAIRANVDLILEANAADVEAGDEDVREKVQLDKEAVYAIAKSTGMLAGTPDPLNAVTEQRVLTDGLVLQRVNSPLGVALALGDAPEVFPQSVSSAIRTGNALMFYDVSGVAKNTYEAFHNVICEAVQGVWPKDAIQLFGREVDLTRLVTQKEDLVDVILIRGSRELAQRVSSMTRIPVLGGGNEAVTHVYVDSAADLEKAVDIVIDSKVNKGRPGCNLGPSDLTCNSMNTLLLHEGILPEQRGKIVRALTEAKVKLYGGPKAAAYLGLSEAPSLDTEWEGQLAATIEIVSGLDEAITTINTHGSSLVDVIVTESEATGERFLQEVDSACVFKNASTRFADGYRLGMGAETGSSTRRIHTRGPAGIKGLLTSRWIVRSDVCHTTQQELDGSWSYTHENKTVTPPPTSRVDSDPATDVTDKAAFA